MHIHRQVWYMVLLLIMWLAECDHDCEVCNNNLMHALVCNKTFKVQSGDWIHKIWLAQGHIICNKNLLLMIWGIICTMNLWLASGTVLVSHAYHHSTETVVLQLIPMRPANSGKSWIGHIIAVCTHSKIWGVNWVLSSLFTGLWLRPKSSSQIFQSNTLILRIHLSFPAHSKPYFTKTETCQCVTC